jgi:hypothetical protein
LKALAPAREPLDLVPADSLLCWYARPLPVPARELEQGEPSTLQTLLELGTRIAGQSLDRGTQLGVRMAEMAGLLTRYPHALVLIDARAKPAQTDLEARRVDRLRFALVVQVAGRRPGRDTPAAPEPDRSAEPFLRIIQKAVNEQTDSGAATLSSHRAEQWSYQELRDQRLPDWAVIAWGEIDGHFVLTIGADVWPVIAAVAAGHEQSLTQDPWYAAARGKSRRTALIEIFVAAEAIQRRLDPFVDGRASEFFQAWEAGPLEQAHWALGFEGRALYCLAHFRMARRTTGPAEDTTVQRLYAEPNNRDRRLLAMIPAEARYAICELPVGPFLTRFFRGLLAIQGDKARANIERIWAQIQAEHGFDTQRDLLDHLGNHVILHTDPPHPLHLPLALTTLIEIRDQPEAVRRTVEALCTAWQTALDRAAAKGGNPPPFTLHRDDDGIWYLRFGLAGPEWFGLAGPAWTVTPGYIILSWSPVALREYLDKVGPEARRPWGTGS